MRRARQLLKQLLRKIIRRDYLILRPDWHEVHFADEGILIVPREKTTYLPVRYNYHCFEKWELRYEIIGNDSGQLRYQIAVPNEPPFCSIEIEICLPFIWNVSLVDEGILMGNGNPLPVSRPLPLDTSWLIGEFEFLSRSGQILRRRTGHRVRKQEGNADETYFSGWIYNNYDEDLAKYPEEVMETIRHYHPLRGRLLDVGCATGLFVEHALRNGLEAEGVDSSEWAVRKANVRTGGRCRLLDFDSAQESDFSQAFDIIVLHSVLEHLRDPERALGLLFRICRPGGIVYIQTLSADSLMHALLKDDWAGYTDHTHKSPWITADWLVRTANSLGFKVVYLRRYYVWNDNRFDDVWRAFTSLIQVYPASVLIEEQFGDGIEVILKKL